MARIVAIATLILAATGAAQVETYDGTSFPEELGWERRGEMNVERWLADGWFYQEAHSFERYESDFYRKPLAPFSGAESFFAEWIIETNGPREEIVEVSPAVLSLAGRNDVLFHTTIAKDRARLIWDVHYPDTFVDFEPGPHVFRVDVYGSYWFEWSIDGVVHQTGTFGRTYPTDDSFVIWGNSSGGEPNTTRWDQITYGIPAPSGIDCDAVQRLKARCKGGKLTGKLFTTLDRGTKLLVTNNGEHQTAKVRRSGKAKVKYDAQPGERTVLLLDCPAVSDVVECD